MLYQRASFTLPAKNNKTDDKLWDFAMLDMAAFVAKYGIKEYKRLAGK